MARTSTSPMPLLVILLACTALMAQSAPSPAATDEEAAEVTGTLIVLNKSGASASLIDLASGEEVLKLPTGDYPHEVAVAPDGRTAVVANYGVGRAPGHTLTVLGLDPPRVIRTIDLVDYHMPHGIVFLKDGHRVVVTTEMEQKTLIVNIESGEVEKAIDTDARVSHMVAVTDDEKRAFVANIGSGSVSVLDLEDGSLIKVIETGRGAEGVDITPDGSQAWVSNRAHDSVSVIDVQSLEVLATLHSEGFPIRLKFTPDGKHALVSNARKGDVAIFDRQTRKLLQQIPMEVTAIEQQDGRLFGDSFEGSPVPVGILVHPSGRRAYVANTNADLITVIDLETMQVAGRLTAGREPDGLGYSSLVLDRK